MLARFAEEAQITAQLEHPNVVPMHDLGLDPEGRAYFSMKLIRGQSLQRILEKRQQNDPETLAKFGLRRLLDVFLQVCQAIEYAHARGVIHRDLKPANIMVGDFGEVLVMDWGVAKLKGKSDASTDEAAVTAFGESGDPEHGPRTRSTPPPEVTSVRTGNEAWATQMGTVLGTPAYMSPEQATGATVDERTDFYALGVILYEMLCGKVPFDEEDPLQTIARMLTEAPEPPSKRNRTAPLALEALALRLLEKDPERRTLTIPQIRAHLHNYIEGIGLDYRQPSLVASAFGGAGALVMFAFLVWYLTGRSIAKVLVLAPPVVLNAVGWFLLVVALGYPLWAGYVGLRQTRVAHDRFGQANSEEIFVSGYLAHRTFSAALAPLFQLVFIVELVSLALGRGFRGAHSIELVQEISSQMRAEWAQALIVILVFMFGYLFLLSTEVRFARKLDRYELLIHRPPWESVWPFFLIVVLLSTIATTDVLDWFLSNPSPDLVAFVREQVVTPPLNLIEIVKTLVFQGTFLLGVVTATMLFAFPFAEMLASLRIPYQTADEASVVGRSQYFLRSMAIFRIARANWLYGGAMIGCLTAITVLTESTERPLVEKVLSILGPSLIGFVGYWLSRRYVQTYLSHSPAVRIFLDQQVEQAGKEQSLADLRQLELAPGRWRLLQLTVPVVCIVGYLLWTGSGVQKNALRDLMMPVTTKSWLLILPYALLVPVLLTRDRLQRLVLRRRNARPEEAQAGASAPL
jgi:hypothetical protein